MNVFISIILALGAFGMGVGIMTVFSLLAYKIVFKRFSTKRQLLAVALVMAVILVATTLYGYSQSYEVKLSGWIGAAYYAATISVGCLTAKLSESKASTSA